MACYHWCDTRCIHADAPPPGYNQPAISAYDPENGVVDHYPSWGGAINNNFIDISELYSWLISNEYLDPSWSIKLTDQGEYDLDNWHSGVYRSGINRGTYIYTHKCEPEYSIGSRAPCTYYYRLKEVFEGSHFVELVRSMTVDRHLGCVGNDANGCDPYNTYADKGGMHIVQEVPPNFDCQSIQITGGFVDNSDNFNELECIDDPHTGTNAIRVYIRIKNMSTENVLIPFKFTSSDENIFKTVILNFKSMAGQTNEQEFIIYPESIPAEYSFSVYVRPISSLIDCEAEKEFDYNKCHGICKECFYLESPHINNCENFLVPVKIGYRNNGGSSCGNMIVNEREVFISYAGSTVPILGPRSVMVDITKGKTFYISIPFHLCSGDKISITIDWTTGVNQGRLEGCNTHFEFISTCSCDHNGGGGGGGGGGDAGDGPPPGGGGGTDCCTYFDDTYTLWEETERFYCIDFFADHPPQY